MSRVFSATIIQRMTKIDTPIIRKKNTSITFITTVCMLMALKMSSRCSNQAVTW